MLSVMLVTYNRPDMFLRAVKSYMAQDYKDKELIIIDNGSKEDYAQNFYLKECENNPDICFYKMDKNNTHDAGHLALDFASGDVCVILHDDDEFNGVNALSKYAAFFDNFDGDVIYTSGIVEIDGKMTEYHSGRPDFKRLLKSDYIYFPGMAFRRESIKNIGWVEDDIRYQTDYDFKLRCFLRGKIAWMDEVVYIYHRHSGQDNWNQTKENIEAENKIIFGRLKDEIDRYLQEMD